MKSHNINLKLFTSIIVIAIVVAGVMILQACKKDEIQKVENNITCENITKYNEAAITYNDIKYVTKLHNDFILDLINNFDKSKENKEEEFLSAMTKTLDKYGVENKKRFIIECKTAFSADWNSNQYVKEIYDKMYEFIVSNLDNSKRVIDYIDKAKCLVLNSNNFREIKKGVDLIIEQATRNLYGNDLAIVKLYCEQLINSSYLWLPKDNGGCGIGYDFMNYLNGTNSKAPLWVKNSLLSDAGAVIVGSQFFVIPGAATPAGVLVWGLSVAGSSIWAGFQTYW